jgi:hypothetical protein
LVALTVLAFGADAVASRAPTPSERTAIVAGIPRDPVLHQACVRYAVRVSTVDPRYASVAYVLPNPLPTTCKGFNGDSIMRLGSNGHWKEIVSGSEFACDGVVPERVMRDLVKYCTYGESNHFYSPSGNIECVLLSKTLLACVTFNNGSSAYLSQTGHARVRPAPAASFFQVGTGIILPYGQYWNCGGAGCSGLNPFNCQSLTAGMKCSVLAINGPSHGFTISRQGVRTF